jgi:hypothetical protein
MKLFKSFKPFNRCAPFKPLEVNLRFVVHKFEVPT